jgi:hypothetical protein
MVDSKTLKLLECVADLRHEWLYYGITESNSFMTYYLEEKFEKLEQACNQFTEWETIFINRSR